MTAHEGAPLAAIERLYAQWLSGELATEDALFAIGDVLDGEAQAASPLMELAV